MKKPVKILVIILAVLGALAAAFFIYVNTGDAELKDASYLSAELKAMNPQTVSVNDVPLIKQPDAFTCGETTLSVMSSFCENKSVTPQMIMQKYQLKGGMDGTKFTEVLAGELPDYQVLYKSKLSDKDLLKEIHGQLSRGIPAPVFFGAPNPYNKPYYDFHASVITGLDLQNGQVNILNVYGYTEQISISEFFNRMSFRGTDHYPLMQKIVIKLGLMDKNSFVYLAKK